MLIGQPGYRRADPDHFALTLGNYVLGGGGFVSRLTEQVREKRGLAYSVYSGFSPGLHAGAFRIGFQTRPDQADEAVKVSTRGAGEVRRRRPDRGRAQGRQGQPDRRLPAAAGQQPASCCGNVANIAWNDLPLDYLETWTARMNAVTVADVKAAFARKLQPETHGDGGGGRASLEGPVQAAAAKLRRMKPRSRTPAPGRRPRRRKHDKRPHEVRIIGGQWKRTRLAVADKPGLRPTPDRVRETLFNWLASLAGVGGGELPGWHCVDAFAGTGALGLEAASRGAASVLLCEQDADAGRAAPGRQDQAVAPRPCASSAATA